MFTKKKLKSQFCKSIIRASLMEMLKELISGGAHHKRGRKDAKNARFSIDVLFRRPHWHVVAVRIGSFLIFFLIREKTKKKKIKHPTWGARVNGALILTPHNGVLKFFFFFRIKKKFNKRTNRGPPRVSGARKQCQHWCLNRLQKCWCLKFLWDPLTIILVFC